MPERRTSAEKTDWTAGENVPKRSGVAGAPTSVLLVAEERLLLIRWPAVGGLRRFDAWPGRGGGRRRVAVWRKIVMRMAIEAARPVGSGRIERHARQRLDGQPLVPPVIPQPPCKIFADGVERLTDRREFFCDGLTFVRRPFKGLRGVALDVARSVHHFLKKIYKPAIGKYGRAQEGGSGENRVVNGSRKSA